MGFTVEDMMVVSSTRYQMKLIAGQGGWSNSISWLLMLEDRTIIRNFAGKEMAVTTGLGFQSEESLLELVRDLIRHQASGLIINTGFYITSVPAAVTALCDENDLPLLTVPWNILLADMIKDLSIRVFLQGSTDEQISAALIHAIEKPDARDRYMSELLPYFDTDGTFQVMLMTTDGLDRMDTVERKRIGYRMQLNLANITHNAHFFYYDACFVLVMNAVKEATARKIVADFIHRTGIRMPQLDLHVGVGSQLTDITRLSLAYRRARSALRMSIDEHEKCIYFDDMGFLRLLYSISDTDLLSEMSHSLLQPLIDYDQKHHSELVRTLELYLQYDESVQAVAAEMYTHRNTVAYRIRNIRQLTGCPLETSDQRMLYRAACRILHMHLPGSEPVSE